MERNASLAAEMQWFTIVEQQSPCPSEPEGALAGEDLQLRAPGHAGSSTQGVSPACWALHELASFGPQGSADPMRGQSVFCSVLGLGWRISP